MVIGIIAIVVAVVTVIVVNNSRRQGEYPVIIQQGDAVWRTKAVSLPNEQGCILFQNKDGKLMRVCGTFAITYQ